MEDVMINMMVPYQVDIPATEGKLLSQLKTDTILRKLSFHEEGQLYQCKGYSLKDHQITGQLQKYKV
jgi:GTP-binding protein HflX